MTIPQLLLISEEQELSHLNSMLRHSDAVHFGASALFDEKPAREWRSKITKLLEP